jgi:branched-subunit amino acid ABC-type transport system permease component
LPPSRSSRSGAGIRIDFIGTIGNFNPTSGTDTLIFAFEAVVIGGLGSLWGTLAGGIALGITQVVVRGKLDKSPATATTSHDHG